MATRHNLCTNPACKNNVTGWGGASTPTRVTVSGFGRTTAAQYTSGTYMSTATGEIVVVSAAGGTYSVTVPSTSVATAGQTWYRVDAVSGGSRKTVVYGPLIVQDL